MKTENAYVPAIHKSGRRLGTLAPISTSVCPRDAASGEGRGSNRTNANVTNDAAANVADMISATASLVRELDTVPMAGAMIFAVLLSTFRIE